MPAPLLSKPDIMPGLEYIWRAFIELSGSRTVHMEGVGCIPLTELLAYCNLFEIVDDQREELVRCFLTLDAHFVALTEKRKPAKKK